MTYQEVLERAKEVEDVTVDEFETTIDLTVEDFDGFDDNWDEVYHDYDIEAVESLIEWLETHALRVEDNYYSYYYFNDFKVCLGYASYDI